MSESLLPDAFAHLSEFVDRWDLPDWNARYRKRLDTPIAEMQRFNDAIVACAEDAKRHLDSKSFDAYDDADRRLLRLMLAFTIVAQAVQIYKQPSVPDSGSVPMLDMTLEVWRA